MKEDLSTCHLMDGWFIQIGEKVIQGSAVKGLHRVRTAGPCTTF